MAVYIGVSFFFQTQTRSLAVGLYQSHRLWLLSAQLLSCVRDTVVLQSRKVCSKRLEFIKIWQSVGAFVQGGTKKVAQSSHHHIVQLYTR